MQTNQIYPALFRGAALAFFASAYADQAEECGQPLGGEIMDQLPAEVDPAATHATTTLLTQFVNEFVYREPGLNLAQKVGVLYRMAASLSTEGADRELTPELFGHYLAMSAMGHGVGLESFGHEVENAFRVPYVEFGSHSLERDYFQPLDE